MKSTNKNISMDFTLKKITTPKFSIIEDFESPKTQTTPIINFNYGVGLSFNVKEKLVKIQFDIVCKRDDKSKAELTSLYLYGISNFESFVKDAATINMPPKFIATLIGIAASTSRGIWFEKTSGTSFKDILLPIIDPNKIAKDIGKSKPQIENS